MKKIFVLFVVLMLASISCAVAADGTDTNTAGKTLVLTGKEIPVSPNVNARYTVLDSNQFYIIGTFHSGGDYLYGSASSITKIFKKQWASDDTKTFDSVLPATKDNAQSESQWTAAGFSS